MRKLLWRKIEPGSGLSPSAASTETREPVPAVPENEWENEPALRTIVENPKLFDIVTPIKVDRFEELLTTHPNRALVESVCDGLRTGFWPYARTEGKEIPEVVEHPNRPMSEEDLVFVRQQRDEEISLGRYSEAFPTLLPGMQTSPIGVVPKPHSDKKRIVVDQSAGEWSLNSYVDRDDASGIHLDNITDLGRALLRFYRKHGRPPRRVFKNDSSSAYRRMPVSALWQVKQVLSIDGSYHVDRCMVIGGRASGKIWCIFFGLVLWIATNVLGIDDIFHYMDDVFGLDDSQRLEYYAPYDDYFPSKQVALMSFWDEIGVPHERKKQVFGESLTIIGFHVDPARMLITMPEESRSGLVAFVRDFVEGTERRDRKRPLREWLRLLGWCNWVLNAYPLLRPALQSTIEKVAGKECMHALIYVNKPVKDDLLWFAEMVESMDGVRMLEAEDWDEEEADAVAMCDSCMEGMGFWDVGGQYSNTTGIIDHPGFYSAIPRNAITPLVNIYFFEAVCVVLALEWYASWPNPPRRLLIYTDSLNTVDAFNRLRGRNIHNGVIRWAANILLKTKISVRVLHVPGTRNTVADALSRELFPTAEALVRSLSQADYFEFGRRAFVPGSRHILTLNLMSPPPPLMMLGAASK